MPDLNYILLFVAIVAPIFVLLKTARSAARNRAWRLAAIVVLIITAMACVISPRHAGFFGGAAWLALLLVPMFALRQVAEAAATQNFSTARRVGDFIKFVHPSRGLAQEREFSRALELAQRGDAR